MVTKLTMSQRRYVRYGIASVVMFAAAGLSASCVSGSVDSGPDGLGGQSSSAGGNITGQGGTQIGTGGGHGGTGVMQQGGTGNAQGGTSPTTGGAGGNAGGNPSGGMSSGGTSSTTGGTGGTGAGGSAGKGGTSSMGGSGGGGPQPLPRITGSQGFLTRFWDCCKPSRGGSKLACGSDGHTQDGGGSACTGGSAYMCYSFAPFVDSANPYVAYAFGATNPQECGACYEIQFTGRAGCGDMSNCPGTSSLLGFKTLYIQDINTGSDVKQGQFDVMIPGGGVGIFNACSKE